MCTVYLQNRNDVTIQIQLNHTQTKTQALKNKVKTTDRDVAHGGREMLHKCSHVTNSTDDNEMNNVKKKVNSK